MDKNTSPKTDELEVSANPQRRDACLNGSFVAVRAPVDAEAASEALVLNGVKDVCRRVGTVAPDLRGVFKRRTNALAIQEFRTFPGQPLAE